MRQINCLGSASGNFTKANQSVKFRNLAFVLLGGKTACEATDFLVEFASLSPFCEEIGS